MSHFANRAMKLTIPVGKPVSHAFAKEAIAGLAGAEVDRLAETKGEDAWDREKAKRSVSYCLDVALQNTLKLTNHRRGRIPITCTTSTTFRARVLTSTIPTLMTVRNASTTTRVLHGNALLEHIRLANRDHDNLPSTAALSRQDYM
jgi:hypothetical protein